jgi:hypothetical protein
VFLPYVREDVYVKGSVGETLRKETLGKTRGGWEDDKGMSLETMDWVYVAWDRDKCRGLVSILVKFRVI